MVANDLSLFGNPTFARVQLSRQISRFLIGLGFGQFERLNSLSLLVDDLFEFLSGTAIHGPAGTHAYPTGYDTSNAEAEGKANQNRQRFTPHGSGFETLR